MIGILILAHGELGRGLVASATHVLGYQPTQLEASRVDDRMSTDDIRHGIEQALRRLDSGQGVLILADIYGATHTNLACGFLARGHIELVAGVNLPMLLRVLNYRHLDFAALVAKALSGGPEGIVCPTPPAKAAGAGG